MLKKGLFLVISAILTITVSVRAEGNTAEKQKQASENKGTITIDIPESKKNVSLSPEKITPPEKSETIMNIQPTDQKTITKTVGTDNKQVLIKEPKPNFEGKYYIPAEGTAEWYAESVKVNNEGIKWESFYDDLVVLRPGDSWNDTTKTLDFQFGTTISALAFLGFAQNGGSKTGDRIKGFLVSAAIMTGLEAINSTRPKQHFCAKNLTAGIAGSIFGSFVLTVGFGF